MNRKRKASGINSYEKELKFKPEEYLDSCREQRHVKWLDLCCGEGNALLQYAMESECKDFQHPVTLLGIDLVDQFQPIPSCISCLRFQTGSLIDWEPEDRYDLVTCVHGLHYIGDKLRVLLKSLTVISDQGLLVANLDLNSIRVEGDPKGQYLKKFFIENEIEYNVRRKLIICKGPRYISLNLLYRGADDKCGPNYTGQDAVDSYYSPANRD